MDPSFCIKAGAFTILAAAHVMQYVAAHASIPVPRISCAFNHQVRSYIVMQRIDGVYVAHNWVWRSKESKASLLGQLRVAFYKQPFTETRLVCGELSSTNILVKGDEVVGIVDWETAVWFPLFWEYVCAWIVNPQKDSW